MSEERDPGPKSEPGKGRPDDEPERPSEKDVGGTLASAVVFAKNNHSSLPTRKRLLDQRGAVWLFAVTEGNHTSYTVEREDQVWRFGLEFSARSKFAREVAKQGKVV